MTESPRVCENSTLDVQSSILSNLNEATSLKKARFCNSKVPEKW